MDKSKLYKGGNKMAYFQIDKNPKKKFFDPKTDRTKLTAEDYEEAADALIKNAEEYFLFIITVSKSNLNQVLDVWCPFLSNCGLVCELLLKSILCLEQTDYTIKLHGKDKHSLFHLYGLLKINTREEIVNKFPHRSEKKENFELCLKENAQTFFELRYSTEYTELAGDMYFIPDLMVTLHNMIEYKKQNKL